VIGPGSTSLSAIRDAINTADGGIRASIVNDGGAAPARLVLTSTRSGATGSMKITVTGDVALSDLLNHDPSSAMPAGQALSETIAAQNARYTLDGISMSAPSNTITDAIGGATLTLKKPTAGNITLDLTRDDAAVTASVNQFVSAYNQINKSLRDVSAYNATTKVAAALNGDATIRTLQTQLRSILSAPVPGSGSAVTMLSQIGVALKSDGTLGIDTATLQRAIGHPGAIGNLFAAVGKTSDSLVSFSAAGPNTASGTYALSVSQVATRGTYQGAVPAGLTVTAGANDTLQVQLNGITNPITLTPGTYTAATLAQEMQSKINGASAFSLGANTVAVTETDGILSISAHNYGATSTVSITGGTDPRYFFGAAPVVTSGTDVKGLLNGIGAAGSGQHLKGAAGDVTEGLRIKITGGATGARGSVTYSQGYAEQFNALLTNLLGDSGAINSRRTGLDASIKSLDKDSARISKRLIQIEARYRAQFTALDGMLGRMSATSSYLTQQLAVIPRL
jgi:flagellar hook-associated protein 2